MELPSFDVRISLQVQGDVNCRNEFVTRRILLVESSGVRGKCH